MEQKSKIEMHLAGGNNPCGAEKQERDADQFKFYIIVLMLPDIVFQIPQTHFVVFDKCLRVFYIGKADNARKPCRHSLRICSINGKTLEQM